MSYAAAAASGPKQTPEEAAAPPPPQIETTESASTGSLVDVDAPSVRTVPSDFLEQDIQTETQAAREERDEAMAKARAEADLAKKKASGKARKADNFLTKWFASLSDDASTAFVAGNLAAVIGISSFLGYKAWGLYERGRLNSKNVGIGASIILSVGIVEGFIGSYLSKGKKAKSS
ncbi:hypothetical protein F4778DRAFT_753829 [Xylariomycetidae sp. FL2044]|nr:hypothetical protein F4778DRAFT_753829 [Xylariomycetidae sp. FL2044]